MSLIARERLSVCRVCQKFCFGASFTVFSLTTSQALQHSQQLDLYPRSLVLVHNTYFLACSLSSKDKPGFGVSQMIDSEFKSAVEQKMYDLMAEAEERRFRVDEYLKTLAGSIESVVKNRFGSEASCAKRFIAAGDQWSRLFLECSIPGREKKLIIRVPLYLNVRLPEATIYGPGFDEVLIYEEE